MKAAAAIILVVISIAAAEPPAGGTPYPPSGWQPNGPAFRLPERSQQSQAPPTLYGPPPQEYGPPSENEHTTTEVPTTTEASTEQLTQRSQAQSEKLQSAKVASSPAAQPSPVYVVVPQAQRLLYAAPLSVASPAFAAEKVVQESSALPIQAVPALAKIQAQYPQVVRYQQLQLVPSVQAYAASLSQTSVVTPYSSSFVQIYQ